MKGDKNFVVEQPCCGCVFFTKCGSFLNSQPFKCSKRIVVDEYGHIPSKEEIEMLYKIKK